MFRRSTRTTSGALLRSMNSAVAATATAPTTLKRYGSSSPSFNQDAWFPGPVVGIDLGTTNSCVAVIDVVDGTTPRVVENSEGQRTTPSIVAYNSKAAADAKGGAAGGGSKWLVGVAAKRQQVTNPGATFHAVKRLIGRRYEDKEVTEDRATLPYKVVPHTNGDAWVERAATSGKPDEPEARRRYSPSQIGAEVLRKMKETAEAHVSAEVTHAVVTVPAYFNDAQRQATKDAGKIAGIKVHRIINEPTAAALCYGVTQTQDKVVAIYDLGGGTFDVSILEIAGGVFEVKSTNGDTHLGGEDFDTALAKYVMEEFKKSTGIDLLDPAKHTANRVSVQRVREAAERAKCELSTTKVTEITLPFLAANKDGEPQHCQLSITRSKLEALVDALIQRSVIPCQQCLEDAGYEAKPTTATHKKSKVDEVLLVGGMTRMPKVIEVASTIFGGAGSTSTTGGASAASTSCSPGLEPFRGVNPDEAVAIGAAIQGSVLKGKLKEIVMVDITALSLGVSIQGGLFSEVVAKNTVYPCSKTRQYTTSKDHQKSIRFSVYQGERALVKDNHFLAEFELELGMMSRGLKGKPKVKVTFDIDNDGIYIVTAEDLRTGTKQGISIVNGGGLEKVEIQRMVDDGFKNLEADRLERERVKAMNYAESELRNAEEQLAQSKTFLWKRSISEAGQAEVEQLAKELKEAIDSPDSSTEFLTECTDDLRKAMISMATGAKEKEE